MVWQSSESLRIDNGILEALDTSMSTIREVLSNAGGWARNDAKAAGDEELDDQLVDFADDWRKTRNHMLQEIDKFQGMVAVTVQGFAQTDEQLANAISTSAHGTISGGPLPFPDDHG